MSCLRDKVLKILMSSPFKMTCDFCDFYLSHITHSLGKSQLTTKIM